MRQRLEALREKYLRRLEEDAARKGSEVPPTYTTDGICYEWSEWRLNLLRSIREVNAMLGEGEASAAPASVVINEGDPNAISRRNPQ